MNQKQCFRKIERFKLTEKLPQRKQSSKSPGTRQNSRYVWLDALHRVKLLRMSRSNTQLYW